MIKIVITKEVEEEYAVTENLVATEKPTALKLDEASWGRSECKVAFDRTYKAVEVKKTRSTRQTLLEQEILNDTNFDLKAVIAAINKLGDKAAR